MAIDYIVTLTDKNLKHIAENLLTYNGIDSSDLRRLNKTKKQVVETIMADPKFKKSLLNTLKTHLSFSNLYDCFSFEDAMGSIDIIKDIVDKLEVVFQENNRKAKINDARNFLIANGYKVD